MKKTSFRLAVILLCSYHTGYSQTSNALKLWYTKPATVFEEAMPVGNGRLGAMVYGGVTEEQLSLNEATLWSGNPIHADTINPNAKNYLKPVREALFNEDYKEAERLVHFMQGPYTESYAPLGNLRFAFDNKGAVTNYKRELDIQHAISKVTYTIDGTQYTREVFASHPDQVIVIKFTATGKDKLNFSCNFDSQLKAAGSAKNNTLQLTGWSPIHAEPSYRGNIKNAIVYDTINGMRFMAALKVAQTDGQQSAANGTLHISNAREVVLLLSMATSYNGFDKNPGTNGLDEKALAQQYLATAGTKKYDALKSRHTKDFSSLFDRVSINLGEEENEKLSTVDRLNRIAAGKTDNSLVALFYQFSRYLLISASRPGGIPTNLQGIWNELTRPPWSSNYTTNINAEMNYWGVESGNLSELQMPFFDLLQRLTVTGASTAKNFYNAGGWALHHNTDIWALTNPVGDYGEGGPQWANWAMGGVWMSTHIWEHYQFTQDRKFLQQTYPIMKGAVQFCLDFLTADKKGNLVTAPSTSPENTFITDKGYEGHVLYGGTADLAMIRQLFNDYINATRVLNTDATMQAQVAAALAKLYPYQVGKAGNLQEWYYDWKDVEPHHRHLSHLFGAFPGNTITTSQTPELADAVRKTLEFRTNDGTGWAITWRIALWARLQNAERAYDAVKKLLRHVGHDAPAQYDGGGGIYSNFLGAHPPFQIDGNFGGGAGIAEMLLQSHQGYIEFLPALPDEWPAGEVKGLVARGGFVVDMKWHNKKIDSVTILSRNGGICKVKTADGFKNINTQAGKSYRII
ncbi:glycoside hydrolase N-terminal domain-containing protein [Chitinophaga sp. Cy-1792]|uniref:glycoside hydrolase family 95 protein n=1 Tax=Chitinophaga sp. Cy-1792 TaxID=2608339 RepID=UPI00141F21FF|nr:glycoside hydrolase family 95 protein [Chitinophaga sp. Cy-1792]NIG55815.1 glycoside hydrolase family 95 protein [Chitinophaga sp. Cy-1792]